MSKIKIERAKKELANLYTADKISAQEYRQAINELEDKAQELRTKIDQQDFLAPLNQTKKDQQLREHLEYQGVDLEHYLNPVLILRTVGEDESLEELAKNFSHRSSFTLLIELFYLCNSQGEISGVSREDLVRGYGYQSGEAAYRALKELEELKIIKIDRSVKPNSYSIINYAQNMKRGGFVLSRDTMLEEAKNLLKKDYRAFFYNCFRRQHSPVNQRVKSSKLSTLKNYINAGSFNEVIKVYKKLEGRLLKEAKLITDRSKKGDNLLKFVYDHLKMRIIKSKDEVIKQVRGHWLYNNLKKIYQTIEIKLTVNNLKQGYQLINKYGEGCFKAVQHNLHKFEQSKTGRVGYFEFMLNQAKIGAII